MPDPVFDNMAKAVLNKAAYQNSPPCERALGGKGNVTRAATMGLQNSDLFGLISAHLVVKRLTEKTQSGEVNQAYKDGVSDVILFLADCASELAGNSEQQKAGKEPEKP